MDIYNWTLQNLEKGHTPAELRKYLIQNGYFQYLSHFQIALNNYKTHPVKKESSTFDSETQLGETPHKERDEMEEAQFNYNKGSDNRNVIQRKRRKPSKYTPIRLPAVLNDKLQTIEGTNTSRKIKDILFEHFKQRGTKLKEEQDNEE